LFWLAANVTLATAASFAGALARLYLHILLKHDFVFHYLLAIALALYNSGSIFNFEFYADHNH
jgi:hypothetical protein